MTTPVRTRHRVRYLETDPQGVVFNMWYLAYCDEAFADFLEAIGAPHDELSATGYEVQVVHAEVDWSASLRAREVVDIDISCSRLGTTSFALRFVLAVADRHVATAHIVYVGTGADGPTAIPPSLRARLEAHRSQVEVGA